MFRKFLKGLRPDNEEAIIGVGISFLDQGDLDRAILQFREALRINPNSDMAHNNLSAVLSKKRDWDGTIREAREALRINPCNDMAHVNLGFALGSKGDVDGEIAHCRQALRINSKNDTAHNNLGLALARKENWDAAIVELREAVRLNPNNDRARDSFAFVLGKRGDWAGMLAEENKVVVKSAGTLADTELIQQAFHRAVQLVLDDQFKDPGVPGPPFPLTGKVDGKGFRENITKSEEVLEDFGFKPEYIRVLKCLGSLLDQCGQLGATPTNAHIYENLFGLLATPITLERAKALEGIVTRVGECVRPVKH